MRVAAKKWIAAAILVVGWLATLGVIALWIKGPDSERRVPCLSNVKQLGLASLMYAGEYDGRMPDRDAWMDRLEPYLNPPSRGHIEHCPSLTDPDLYGYAFNATVKRDDDPRGGYTPLIYESVNLGRNASDLFTSLPPEGRHSGGNYVGRLDGHAKWVRASKANPK